VVRQGHRRKDGSRVKGTSYCATDRGRPGKGPKTIPTPRAGALGGPGYTERSDSARRRILDDHTEKYGYASTVSALQSRINLGSQTMSERALSVFQRDKKWLQAKHDKGNTTMAKKRKSSKRRNPGKTSAPRKSVPKGKGLAKAHAIRGAMLKLGISKTAANKLYNEGRLTPSGERKAAKRKATKKKTAKKKSRGTGRKKASKKKAAKRTASDRKYKRGAKICKSAPKRHSKAASKAAGRVQRGQKGRSGRPLAATRWCRNFMDLTVPEAELYTA